MSLPFKSVASALALLRLPCDSLTLALTPALARCRSGGVRHASSISDGTITITSTGATTSAVSRALGYRPPSGKAEEGDGQDAGEEGSASKKRRSGCYRLGKDDEQQKGRRAFGRASLSAPGSLAHRHRQRLESPSCFGRRSGSPNPRPSGVRLRKPSSESVERPSARPPSTSASQPTTSISTAAVDPRLRASLESSLQAALDSASPAALFSTYLHVCGATPLGPLFLSVARTRAVLHRLVEERPRTRGGLQRVLRVVENLRARGATVGDREYRAVIGFVGRCFRKAGRGELREVMAIFAQMVRRREGGEGEEEGASSRAVIDRKTYNVVLDVVSRAWAPDLFDRLFHRMVVLDGISPDRFTYMARLRRYAVAGDLAGVRRTVQDMARASPSLRRVEMDEVNAGLWAHARYGGGGRLSDVMGVYRGLRRNAMARRRRWLSADERTAEMLSELRGEGPPARDGESEEAVNRVLGVGRLSGTDIPFHDGLVPNGRTFGMVVQTLAYRGSLAEALDVMEDMVNTPVLGYDDNKSSSTPSFSSSSRRARRDYLRPTLAMYMALFVGFARHAERPLASSSASPSSAPPPSPSPSPWTREALDRLLESFLTIKPSEASLAGQEASARLKRAVDGLPTLLDDDDDDDEVGAAGVGVGGRKKKRKRRGEDLPIIWNPRSIISPPTHRAPTRRELFFLITALRRVSGDDAEWVLSRWAMVMDKFGPEIEVERSGRERTDGDGGGDGDDGYQREEDDGVVRRRTSANREGWTGLRIGKRLRRVLSSLEEMVEPREGSGGDEENQSGTSDMERAG